MKPLALLTVTLAFCLGARGQKLMFNEEYVCEFDMIRVELVFYPDSTYKISFEKQVNADSVWLYTDKGKFTFNGTKLQLFSNKTERKKEDCYFEKDILTVKSISEGIVYAFSAKTTAAIAFGKNKKIIVGEIIKK